MTFPRRLGKNLGGYFGERIDIRSLLREIDTRARAHGWESEELPVTPGLTLLALRRRVPKAGRAIYLSAGIHGDEPAGPLAMRRLIEDNRWPGDADVWFCPCLNPGGYERGTRENPAGIDLNRDYRGPKSVEVQAHVRWLEQQPRFDYALCLHEDWESHGFYVYERNPGMCPPLAPRILEAVAQICPIDHSPEIEGRPAERGMILVNEAPETRELWPETIYLTVAKTEQSCTLEAPSDFSLAVRVDALVAAVNAVLFP